MGSCNHPLLVDTKSPESNSVRAGVGKGTEVRNVCDISTSGSALPLMPMFQHPEMEIPAPSRGLVPLRPKAGVLTFREITLISEASELEMRFCYCVGRQTFKHFQA